MIKRIAQILLPKSFSASIVSLFGTLIVLIVFFRIQPNFTDQKQQAYSDIIASHLVWGDQTKSSDIIFAYIVSVFTFLSFFIFSYLSNKTTLSKPTHFLNKFLDRVSLVRADNFLDIINNSILALGGISSIFFLIGFFHKKISPPAETNLFLYLTCIGAAIYIQFNPTSTVRKTILIAIKALIPFLLFRFYKFDYFLDGKITSFTMNANGIIFLTLLFLISLYFTVLHLKRDFRYISPVQVIILASFFTLEIPIGSVLSSDSYHMGEMLIPYEQIFSFQLKNGADFVSVHGILAFIYGFIQKLFFGDMYATVPISFSLTATLFTGLLTSALLFSLSTNIALVFAIFILPSWNRFYMILFVLILLANKKIYSNNYAWFFLGFLLSIMALIFNYAPGLAIVFAVLPMIFYRLADVNKLNGRIVFFYLSTISLLILLFWNPLSTAFSFIMSNWEGTQTGFGISINERHSLPTLLKNSKFINFLSFYIEEIYKFLKLYVWIPACLTAFSIANLRKNHKEQLCVIVLVATIISFAMIPYSYGRVGTEGLSRIGSLSFIYLGFLAPFIFLYEKKDISILTLLVLCSSTVVLSFPHLKTFKSPLATATAVPILENNLITVPEDDIAVPSLNKSILTRQEYLEQIDFSEFLQKKLIPPFQSYYDFTNQQNFYYIHKKPAIYFYPSHVVALNQTTQEQIIHNLAKSPPAFVWAAPSQDHEFFKSSLRTYRVYRWLLLSGYSLVEKSNAAHYSFLVPNPQKNQTKENTSKLVEIFLNPDLGYLPKAWGRNWHNLKGRFIENKTLEGKYEHGFLNFLFHQNQMGYENDFLLLDLPAYKGKMKIYFTNEDGLISSSTFSTSNESADRIFLIPIGGDPRWLLSSTLKGVQIELDNRKIEITNAKIKLLKLIK